ncbi:TfoX/Sxy family protein [Pseudoprimorskyibacter insulae]|nr:TfoX/Sxy family protein [Pseudoprimorskyibacter insulae]
MQTPISSMRNLGPAVERECTRAGIASAEDLRELGAHEAYRRMLLSGTQAHFIGYYVLHMALQGRPWNDCKGKEKDDLRQAFDALKAEVAGHKDRAPAGIDRILDEIGVIARR